VEEITTSTTTIPAAQRPVLDVVDKHRGTGGNDRVGRVDDLPDFRWEGQERGEAFPGPFPHGDRGFVLAAQGAVGELEQGGLGGLDGGGGVDRFQRGGELLAVGVGGVFE
jgi:hypothetical protein